MKRSKPPVLTSPWKIGFFVALMLVAVSSAVAFFFVRQTGLTWSTPRWTDWNSILSSVLQNEGTIFEMWPLLAVVTTTALLCYFVISRAVRKYKGYLDSGHDYKELLASIHEITDLEDKSRIDRLQNHPELRDFLIGARDTVMAKTKELDQREESLQKRAEGDAAEIEQEFRSRLSVDSDRLVSAIRTAASVEFPDAVEIAMPELQDVVAEVRTLLANHNVTPATGGEAMHGAEEITRDLEAGIETGRDIEKHLRDAIGNGSTSAIDTSHIRQEIDSLVASLTDTKQLSVRLDEIDEDTKNVAINTAFKAGSSNGTQADLINLADEVKGVAAKFGDVTNSWRGLAESITGHVNAIEAELNRFLDSLSANSSSSEVISGAADKVSRCVEHLVVLTEKIKAASETSSTSPEPTAETGMPETPQFAQTTDEVVLETPSATEEAAPADQNNDFEVTDFGFESIDRSKPLFSGAKKTESEESIFEKQPEAVISDTAEEPADNMFAELEDAPVTDESVELENEPPDPSIPDVPIQAPATGPESSGEFVVERNMVDMPETSTESTAATMEEDAIDLYALGAVDFDAALHN